MNRPSTSVVLAMTVDGKIADFQRSAARFGSARDRERLERQIALADAVLLGAKTLHAYGTTLPVTNPRFLEERRRQGKPPQPVHIAGSGSARFDPQLPFFRQPVPRWLLTTRAGARDWQQSGGKGFERVLIAGQVRKDGETLDWVEAWRQLSGLGIQKLAVLGGGETIASLLAENLIDEFYLTLCPWILGGVTAPSPVEGPGFPASGAKQLELVSAETAGQEVFLHYRVAVH